jgi:N6-adenosine-specific RNA methylase IME4
MDVQRLIRVNEVIDMRKYKIIYADPPWAYNESGSGNRVVHAKYPTMQIEDICDIPVKEISEDDSILFLWATFPRMPEALKVIESWGFKYKGLAYCWIKKNKKSNSNFWGLGYYTRQNPEVLLVGVRGKVKKGTRSASEHCVVNTRIEEHSKKPAYIRDMLPLLVENGENVHKIELFARQKTKDWDIWGNELENSIELTPLNF